MSTNEELLGRGLQKWLQHYVTGESVTIEQAKEIIRRTDSFFVGGYGGNNHAYDKWVRETLRMPDDYTDSPRDGSDEDRRAWWERQREQSEAFKLRWRPVDTEYVHNSWLSCSFVGGPHGWCHPDGRIGFIDNVGKWPSVENVLADWQAIAAAWPFLKIGATLFSGEECETDRMAVVSLVISSGAVVLADPALVNVHAGHEEAVRRTGGERDATNEFIARFNDPRRERGIPDEWIREWAKI